MSFTERDVTRPLAFKATTSASTKASEDIGKMDVTFPMFLLAVTLSIKSPIH